MQAYGQKIKVEALEADKESGGWAESGQMSQHWTEQVHVLQPKQTDSFAGLDGQAHDSVLYSGLVNESFERNQIKLSAMICDVQSLLEETRAISESKWPMQYPVTDAVASPERANTYIPSDSMVKTDDASPSMAAPELRTGSTASAKPLRRQNSTITSTIRHEFQILNLNVKLGGSGDADLVHSLPPGSVATLFLNRVTQALHHLEALRRRIEDTSSKVLVTGDLNAGKSTLCNALLRRNLLPSDQQPCTELFSELRDAQLNNGVEEVHAVKAGAVYTLHDEASYDVFTLEDLEQIVVQVEKYVSLKIYIKEDRSTFLHNGLVDISLIDAPGLNSDSVKTTAVFARQEEIDVVVFVVSAENHFTLSAKEFIWTAANEKAHLFVVVNRFDQIRDRARCRRQILEQLQNLSPTTYQDASELVHFVSANIFNKDKRDLEDITAFAHLEASLRQFVLEKRSKSKLAPARTYLVNLLADLDVIAQENERANDELRRDAENRLSNILPLYEQTVQKRFQLSTKTERIIEETCVATGTYAREKLGTTLESLDQTQLPPYQGLTSLMPFADSVRHAMIERLSIAIAQSQSFAKERTISGVNTIRSLGIARHNFDRTFKPEAMFTRKRQRLASHDLKVDLDVWDFMPDWWSYRERATATAWVAVLPLVSSRFLDYERLILSGIKLFGGNEVSSTSTLRNWVFAGCAGLASCSALYMVATTLPSNVPRNVARKIKQRAHETGYVDRQAEMMVQECSRVLRIPERHLRETLTRDIEEQQRLRDELSTQAQQARRASQFFLNIFQNARKLLTNVEAINL